ncbi:recombinase family protein [Rhodococcus sp. WS3]|uniref:recombinase family protein n=1 Tax=Rhodococcus sp. WS3 TaxID=2486271 RepID=UPI0039679C31
MIFQIFGALSEFERNLVHERTRSGLVAARDRGRIGGRATGDLDYMGGYKVIMEKIGVRGMQVTTQINVGRPLHAQPCPNR